MLAGAGPTLFCLVDSQEEGEAIASRLAARDLPARYVQTITTTEALQVRGA